MCNVRFANIYSEIIQELAGVTLKYQIMSSEDTNFMSIYKIIFNSMKKKKLTLCLLHIYLKQNEFDIFRFYRIRLYYMHNQIHYSN